MGLCCSTNHASDTDRASPPPPKSSYRPWTSRARATLAWALPITTLTLIPKCPACLAAYVLLFTGIGVSLPAASAMRSALIAICVLTMAALLVRAAITRLRRRVTTT